jgi:hypothetical protein
LNTLDPVKRRTLPIILLCAVVQGWCLYGLHLSITNHVWPATQPAWLLALYSIMVFVPVTIELLAASESRLLGWCLITTIAAIIFYIGWFHGAHMPGPTFDGLEQYGLAFPMAFELLLWWLVLLPFVQSRLVKGSWSADYGQLFASAWRNKLTLAEACLFTA